jgi:hypothetical protein
MEVVAIIGAGCVERAEEGLRFVRANDVDLVILAWHPVDPSQPYGGAGTA